MYFSPEYADDISGYTDKVINCLLLQEQSLCGVPKPGNNK